MMQPNGFDPIPSTTIELVRSASRQLVRELGFMRDSLAGTDLPPSSVHALIEIEGHEGITASELSDRLRLEKSSVSRMLRKLIVSGEIEEKPGERDGRTKALSLSENGQERVAGIHAFARAQVASALERLRPEERQTVLEGLRLYAAALAPSANNIEAAHPIRIESGYRLGLISRLTEMHALYYAGMSGFGQRFESIVASGLSDFCNRLDRACNEIWLAIKDDRIVGAIAIDGEDLGPHLAHLRWFIVDSAMRGHGIGRQLLSRAIRFSEERGFTEIHLCTFAGLDAARRLYETSGFECVEERRGDQWGNEVMEQRFVRRIP